jgi:hypothetical protein
MNIAKSTCLITLTGQIAHSIAGCRTSPGQCEAGNIEAEAARSVSHVLLNR